VSKTFKTILIEFRACGEAKEWVGDKTLEEAWETCERTDWMLWLAAKAEVDRKTVVLAACAVARTALQYVKPGELRPLNAIETAEAWTRGETTLEEVRRAAYAASYAAVSDAAAASYAAAAASYAADAAYTVADYADDAAAYADDAWPAAKAEHLRVMCEVVRRHYPAAPVIPEAEIHSGSET